MECLAMAVGWYRNISLSASNRHKNQKTLFVVMADGVGYHLVVIFTWRIYCCIVMLHIVFYLLVYKI